MSGPIERVVVTLDAGSENRAAIETAVRLAARTGMPLHGAFVEDEDLLRLAGLPFARQVTIGRGIETLTPESVALHLLAQAEQARQELSAAATQYRVEYSFEIVRGAGGTAAGGTAAGGASERDLVVAGGLTRPIAGWFRVECRWWSTIEATPAPFLLARTVSRAAPGAVAILLRDRNPASVRLFDAAAQIAAAEDSVLAVLCPPAMAGAAGFDKWITDRAAAHPVRLQIEAAPSEPAALSERLGQLGCRLVALEARLSEGGGQALRSLAAHFAGDILIVP
jgi:nucleotide-binding universal stress UspA family protein